MSFLFRNFANAFCGIMKRKVIVASDSFKGTYTSAQIGEMVASVLPSEEYEVKCLTCSDGGEGFCRCLTNACGGIYNKVLVHDPLGRIVCAEYGIIDNDTAVIEVAQACGLMHLKPEEYDPWNASSYGVGEMIADALKKGYRKIIIGLGGSATSDCGKGMLEALKGIGIIDECEFTIASDVTNPLCGKQGAAYVYAPQKGADAETVGKIEERTLRFGQYLEQISGKSIINLPGAGAAGGIGAALLTMNYVKMVSGIELLLDRQHFDEDLRNTDIVITGEGCIDEQTLNGKAPYRIAQIANNAGVPCVALYGRLKLSSDQLVLAPWRSLIQIKSFTEETLRKSLIR